MSHATDQSPDYILLAHYDDDTLSVITHYHSLPEESEVNAACAEFYRDCPQLLGLIRFQLAAVQIDSTPALLELVATQ